MGWWPQGASLLLLAGTIGTLTGCGAAQTPAAASIPKNAQTVQVTATNWAWTMSHKTFQAGRPIAFVLQSKTGVHGFSIVQTDISRTVRQGDAPVAIVWTPPGPGQYNIRCNVYCGGGHDNMFTSFRVR